MRNKVLLICMLAFFLCGAGCIEDSSTENPVEVVEPVEIPARHFLTLSDEQLLLLDWEVGYRRGASVKEKRIMPGAAVEFDIYFPSNRPDDRSVDIVSSGEGGRGNFVGTNIQGYETFALKFTLVSVNGQSTPDMKHKIVVGAIVGPTDRGELSTYEPVILGFASSENTVIAKTPVTTDKIYRIGFHVHMQNPEDWDPGGSIMRLTVEPIHEEVEMSKVTAGASDSAALTGFSDSDSASTVTVRGAPVITSVPVTNAIAELLYSYDVDAVDPDEGDILRYSLATKPSNMIINSTTGLIKWQPTIDHVGTSEKVVVRVTDNSSNPAIVTQSFVITVNPPPFNIKRLSVFNGYDQRKRRTLIIDGSIDLVRNSDDKRLEVNYGTYISFEFSDISIPANAEIQSVVVFVEHFEEERFDDGKLEWSVGTGWPAAPVVLASIKAPLHIGESNESVDSWDITSLVNTNEKINSLQLQVKNNSYVVNSKTLIDCTYLAVTLD